MPSTPLLSSPGTSNSASPSSVLAILPFEDDDPHDSAQPAWRTILSDSHQVVLYNSDSHALSVRQLDTNTRSEPLGSCPYCNRPLEGAAGPPPFRDDNRMRASNYFQLLEVANESSSRPSSRARSRFRSVGDSEEESESHSFLEDENTFRTDAMAEGYFHAFFKEEYRLGMGANGSVFLCQHVLDGNPLGHFAVKKIAVGQSHSYLLKILREVRLLEQLRHPNIITYHHAWLETYQFSSFGPKIPTLFVLMQWAEGGSLDDFIDARLGHPHHAPSHSGAGSDGPLDDAFRSRSDRIRAFRAARARPQEERERRRAERARGIRTAVHLLGAEEAKSLFTDVTSGLAFLHDKSILHLDLKPGNVLLTWDVDALIPRAMLSDFGTSRDMIRPSESRTGNTGTLEFTAPEALRSPQTGLLSQIDSKADMWSLGMILHTLLFFRLPYLYSRGGDSKGNGNGNGDIEKLEKEVLEYEGFKRNATLMDSFERRGLPAAYLILLESLLNRLPKKRPTCDQVLRAIAEGNFDPQAIRAGVISAGTLVPRPRGQSPPIYSEKDSGDSGDTVLEGNGTAVQQDESLDDAQAPSELELDTPRPPIPDKDSYLDEQEEPTAPLLALPPANPSLMDTVSNYRLRSLLLFLAKIARCIGIARPGAIRVCKSAVLAMKVFTLFSKCPQGRPEPVFLCFTLGLAISDTWSESLWPTPLLIFVHFFILHFHCFNHQCCVLRL
ncbi:kinase-like protein [Fomitiporia mediterranea MF3/22]|uniref:kinase-like protein n=1 Tax=Fomitiporia mediterranea (strain MF3/22) TaxID=694068 RepID=UPI0004409180|nr:kinase-like protein [Fomitiporia mediterranea MF3/22]EJD05480.1 kinase-like protein [Fomitiporia mediterranea MF3/22]